ncbi:MAG: MFS transporter [Micrococcales bacterium]
MSQINVDAIQRRTVKVLTAGQILSGFGLGSTLSIGSLLAVDLSGTEAWAGSAATAATLGAATWAIPLARLAYAKGRRVALATGAGIAITGASLIITAASLRFFPLLLLAIFVLGAGSAVGLQARFAATDLPHSGKQSRDLSLVVWATTIGAVIGPNLFGPGEVIGTALHLPHLTGPFVVTIVAQISASLMFFFGLKPDPLLTAKQLGDAKKLKPRLSIAGAVATLRKHPRALYAVITIALSHMVMVSVMSMTPAHLKMEGATLVVVGFTISIHIAGMYAFSPLFGMLADKIGKLQTVLVGQLIYIAALLFAGFGMDNHNDVLIGLFLLGLGWSASTVSASALLSASLPIEDKANVQGVSDTLMNLSGAFGGAISGTIMAALMFVGLNMAALVPVSIILALSAIALLRSKAQQGDA